MDHIPLVAVIEKRLQPDGTMRPEITRLRPMNWLERVLNKCNRRKVRLPRPVSVAELHDTAYLYRDIDVAIGIDQRVLCTLFGNSPAGDYITSWGPTRTQQRINLILTPSRSLVIEAEAAREGVRV